MKSKMLTFAALTLLAGVGIFSATPAMAQARPTIVQNTDEAGRAPFQTTVSLNFSTGAVIFSVPIPAGKRLVIDYVSAPGAASSNAGPIQPIIILGASVAGSPFVNYYLTEKQSPLLGTQFSMESNPKIYADSLTVSFAFSGFTPSFAVFNVSISGHLITISPTTNTLP